MKKFLFRLRCIVILPVVILVFPVLDSLAAPWRYIFSDVYADTIRAVSGCFRAIRTGARVAV